VLPEGSSLGQHGVFLPRFGKHFLLDPSSLMEQGQPTVAGIPGNKCLEAFHNPLRNQNTRSGRRDANRSLLTTIGIISNRVSLNAGLSFPT
jgi:hypothetical protein